MNPNAVEQARERFARAERAVEALESSTAFSDIRLAWSNFLTAASTIYSKLEQGSKSSEKSRAWYVQKKKFRKEDELLRYIHHARNSDEHGIEEIVDENSTGRLMFPKPNGLGSFEIEYKWPRDHHGSAEDLKKSYLHDPKTGAKTYPIRNIVRKYLRVTTVYDSRFGDRFEPPQYHLGKELSGLANDEPKALAVLALSYLKTFIEEAELLIMKP